MNHRISLAPRPALESKNRDRQPVRHLVSVPPLAGEPHPDHASGDRHRPVPSYSRPPGSIDAAIRLVIREEVRSELRAALAEHRQEERSHEGSKLVPLVEAARKLGLTPKALRARIERGSIDGATKIGGRWHVSMRGDPTR
jgi:hypothetical protein